MTYDEMTADVRAGKTMNRPAMAPRYLQAGYPRGLSINIGANNQSIETFLPSAGDLAAEDWVQVGWAPGFKAN